MQKYLSNFTSLLSVEYEDSLYIFYKPTTTENQQQQKTMMN